MGLRQCSLEGLGGLMVNLDFYKGKRVFVTGHTGFKGSWLCRILVKAGAEVTGYALPAPEGDNLFSLAGLEGHMTSVMGDVRNMDTLWEAFRQARPEIVLHLAAQPLVREGYRCPRETYETNVMGTVNLLECVRRSEGVRSVLNVTTDKVYLNNEGTEGFKEDDPLDGFDPYSNSKSCSELVTHCYQKSFFAHSSLAVSTARAGNVIGGGDFARDRIVPDCVRAAAAGKAIHLRNPHSVRPYQHVLEPLFAYLMIAWRQYEDPSFAGWYNVGPDEADCVTTAELAQLFCESWGDGARWEACPEAGAPHEAGLLRLDCSLLKQKFGWQPRWNIRRAIQETVAWSRVFLQKGNIPAEMDRQIRCFMR